ncbi:hypothetical protein [Nocardia macrotermitis]|uniref:hypothetical protein n=1 Tax=Nocardia macrotermitis TaxID=2585198 RepID=UPI00222884C2|nr:hypothetical protein [Nocardia macrotermitis]
MPGGGLGDPEDGDDGAGAGDLDFGDERFDQGFAGLVAAVGDECGDVVGDVVQGGRGGLGGGVFDGGDEFVAAAGALADGVPQCGQAWADHVRIHGVVFERGEIAVDLGVGVGDLGADGGQFVVLGGVRGAVLASGSSDRVGDECVVVAVERCQALEHGGFGGVRVEAVAVAFAAVVAVAVVADVVAVHLAAAVVA